MNPSYSNLKYREYQLSDDFPVLVLSPKSVQSTFSAVTPHYHFHNCIEIGICYEGIHTLSFEDKDFLLAPNNFFILSPYSMHFLDHDNPSDGDNCEYIYINLEKLLHDFFPLGLPKDMQWYKSSSIPFIFSAKDSPMMYNYLNMIVEEWYNKRENYTFIIKGLFLSLMIELTRTISLIDTSPTPRYRNMSVLLPALQYMHNNLDNSVSSAELAILCGLSTSGFRTLFLDLIGETPRHYLNRLRLQKACDLLYSTELSILDISIEAGFQSLSNFYRSFKEYYDISPKDWRNRKRAIHKKNIHYIPFSPD